MTQKEIKKAQNRLEALWSWTNVNCNTLTISRIAEIVELELQLEAECGQ